MISMSRYVFQFQYFHSWLKIQTAYMFSKPYFHNPNLNQEEPYRELQIEWCFCTCVCVLFPSFVVLMSFHYYVRLRPGTLHAPLCFFGVRKTPV